MPEQGVRTTVGPPPSRSVNIPPGGDGLDDDGRTAESTVEFPVETFQRVVAPPVNVEGDAVAGLAVAGQARFSRGFSIGPWVLNPGQDDITYTENESFTDGRLDEYGSGYGQWQPWTSGPSWSYGGGILDYTTIGADHREQWYQLVMPAHPTDAAGIYGDFEHLPGNFGYIVGSGYANVGNMEVVVSTTKPTGINQGTLVGAVAPGVTSRLLIPIGSLPAEGETVYIGMRPGWQSNYIAQPYDFMKGWPHTGGVVASEVDRFGDQYNGFSGGFSPVTPDNLNWGVVSVAGDSLGAPSGGDDSPWDAGEWATISVTGSPDYGVDPAEGGLYSESEDPTEIGFKLQGSEDEEEDDIEQDAEDLDTSEDEGVLDTDIEVTVSEDLDGVDKDEVYGFWSDTRGQRINVTFSVTAIGDEGEPGLREIELRVVGDRTKAVAKAHIGDPSNAPGVSAAGPTASEYSEVAMVSDTLYTLSLDTRAEQARAKLFEVDGLLEPANWPVGVALEETEDDGDRFELWLRTTDDVRITIHKISAMSGAAEGDEIVGELIGLADGATRAFETAHRYVLNSLILLVNGSAVKPTTESLEDASAVLDHWPTGDSVVRASYTVADEEETEDEEDA